MCVTLCQDRVCLRLPLNILCLSLYIILDSNALYKNHQQTFWNPYLLTLLTPLNGNSLLTDLTEGTNSPTPLLPTDNGRLPAEPIQEPDDPLVGLRN